MEKLFWPFVIAVSVGGFILCWFILSSKWHKLIGTDHISISLNSMVLETARMIHPIMPGHPGYMDLKFSILRHAVAFALFAFLYTVTSDPWHIWLLAPLHTLYSLMPIYRYRGRVKYFQEYANSNPEEESVSLELPLQTVKDSRVNNVYSIVCMVALFLVNLFLP